jgi:hypothetical protein
MNHITTLLTVTVVLGLLVTPQVFGQRGPNSRGGGGWGGGSQYNRLYDTKTVETVAGEVIAVKHITPIKRTTVSSSSATKTAFLSGLAGGEGERTSLVSAAEMVTPSAGLRPHNHLPEHLVQRADVWLNTPPRPGEENTFR